MSAIAKMSDMDINLSYQRQKNELQSLASKIGDLETNAEEHALVIDTLDQANKADPERKCFRMIGGTLVEATVKEVKPALDTNLAEMKKMLEMLVQQYVDKDKAFNAFQVEHKIEQTRPQTSSLNS